MGTKNPNLIVKNSTYLFVRQMIILLIAFYTTRLTLQLLGDEDYGINNVVGGVVAVFSVISFPIINSLQRFFNVEFTKGIIPQADIFITSKHIILLMTVVVAFFYETIGLYVVNFVIEYPLNRSFAVDVIFQLSILSTIASFLFIPYTALLFAKEEMGLPALLDIADYVYKLAFLMILPFIEVDYLIAYSFLFFIGRIIVLMCYIIYTHVHYKFIVKGGIVNEDLQRRMFSFSGWNMIESFAGITITFVSNILMNIFGGLLYNTAYGISRQIQSAILSFVSNLMKAIDPQITSNTVVGEAKYRDGLIRISVKLSVLFLGSALLIFHYKGFLFVNLWLGHIPQHVLLFTQIILISVIVNSVVLPLRTIILAVGKIKFFFMAKGLTSFSCIITMYCLLKIGYNASLVMYLFLFNELLFAGITIITCMKVSNFEIFKHFVGILLTAFELSVSFYLLKFADRYLDQSWSGLVIEVFLLVCFILPTSYYFVLSSSERYFINNVLITVCKKVLS